MKTIAPSLCSFLPEVVLMKTSLVVLATLIPLSGQITGTATAGCPLSGGSAYSYPGPRYHSYYYPSSSYSYGFGSPSDHSVSSCYRNAAPSACSGHVGCSIPQPASCHSVPSAGSCLPMSSGQRDRTFAAPPVEDSVAPRSTKPPVPSTDAPPAPQKSLPTVPANDTPPLPTQS